MIGWPRGRCSSVAGLLLGLVLVGAWAVERWGPGLISPDRSFAGSVRVCALDQVLDGDSLRLDCHGDPLEVRLHCIDAPEKDQQPWSDRSRANLRRITPQRVEVQPVEIDRFGRTVAEVYATGVKRYSLNLEQVRGGHAAVYPRYCDDPRFFRVERQARRASAGIWSTLGEHQTPWAFRHRR